MNVWSPKSFIEYVREQSSDAYYPRGEDQDEDNDNVLGSSGSSHVDTQLAIRQQDNLDPDVTLHVAGTERQMFPRKRVASLI